MIKLNFQEVKFHKFNSGENAVHKDNLKVSDKVNHIYYQYTGDESLIRLMLLTETVREMQPSVPVDLIICYMPHARMDRINDTFGFHLQTVAKMINMMNFSKVYVIDPHSPVTTYLLNNVEATYPLTGRALVELARLKDENEYKTYVVFPDKGAYERYGDLWQDYPVLYLNKSRDFATGRITGMELAVMPEEEKFNAIILDDICSYGGTFLGASSILRENGAQVVKLCVTYGEAYSMEKGHLYDIDSPVDEVVCLYKV